MNNEENKGTLPEDDVGRPDETTDIEDRINATLDKILDDDEDEFDDIQVDYEDPEDEEPDNEAPDEENREIRETEDDYEKTKVWTDSSEEADEEESEEVMEEEPEQEEEVPAVRSRHKSARPGPVIYVPMDELDQNSDVPPGTRAKKKTHKGLKIFGLVMLMIIVLGGCAYGGISYYFTDRFFEGTWINGVDCSQKTAYEVEQLMAEKLSEYSIEVSSRNIAAQTIRGEDIDYQYMSTGEILQLLKKQKPYEWIRGLYEQKSYTVSENVGYNKTLLQEQLKSLNCAQAENQVEPENAYVAFRDNQFVIVPETEGSKLNIKEAYKLLDAAVEANEASIDFSDNQDAYVSAEVTQDDPALQSALEACNNYTKASITYTFGDQSTTLDGNTIKDWLQFDEKGQLVWDDNFLSCFRAHSHLRKLGLKSLEDLDIFAFFCKSYDRFFGFSCFSNNCSTAFFLTIHVHGIYALNFCSFEHFLNSLFDLRLVCFRMYQECVFLFSHGVHGFFCDNRFQDHIIILNICHYAYTSSMDATASLVTTTVLCFITSYTFIVFTVAVCTSAMFLAEIATFWSSAAVITRALSALRFVRTFCISFVLASASVRLSTTTSLLS